MKSLLLLFAPLLLVASCSAASVYPTRLDDPAAVYLTPQEFHVHGDGKEDDSEAVQAAIDKAGPLFGLVNNASRFEFDLPATVTAGNIAAHAGPNLAAPVLLTR